MKCACSKSNFLATMGYEVKNSCFLIDWICPLPFKEEEENVFAMNIIELCMNSVIHMLIMVYVELN